MQRTIIIILALFLAAPLLSGCGAHRASTGPNGPSLMDRFAAGRPLFDEPGDKDSDQTATPQPAQLAAQADAARRAGRLDAAMAMYSNLLKDAPDHVPALYGRGMTLFAAGRNSQAMDDFKAVLAIRSGHAGALEGAGLVYLESGLADEAEQSLLSSLALDPGRFTALTALGAARSRRGDQEGAAQAYARAVRTRPSDSTARHNLGTSLLMSGRFEQAAKALMEAVRLGSREQKTFNNLGLALYRLDRPEQALEAFASGGTRAAAYNNLGWFMFMDSRHAEAVELFERAIALEPRFYVRAHENLKRARLAMGFARGRSGDKQPTTAPAIIPTNTPASISAIVPASAPATIPTIAPASISKARPAVAEQAVPASPTPALARNDRFQAPAPAPARSYTVHISSWRSSTRARQQASRLSARLGIETYVFSVNLGERGVWHRVTTGIFLEKDEARRELDRLGRAGLSDMRIIRRTQTQNRPQATPGSGRAKAAGTNA